MKLSIVATLYRSELHVGEFCRRASAAASTVAGDAYEIVLVNDGSPDASLERALDLARSDRHVVVVDLSRNFGHEKAMMTGLAHATGDLVFLVDTDLEEEPEWLLAFAAQMEREGCDTVYGVQTKRKGGWFERWSGSWFYRLFRWLSGLDVPANMTTARLMTRRYVDALLQHGEREFEIGGLCYITGYHQSAALVTKHRTSASTYTLSKKLSLLVTSITAFSSAPLVYIFYCGLLISASASVYTVYLVVRWLFDEQPLLGWTSIMASVWLIGGWVILFIGVIGIYLSRIFLEVKQRPFTIVRQVHRQGRARPQAVDATSVGTGGPGGSA